MAFQDLKKEICWFWKTDLNRNKTQEKIEPEDKVVALNSRENKCNNNNGKLFKVECNKCGKYDHIDSYFWRNSNKVNDNRNDKKNRKRRFNR